MSSRTWMYISMKDQSFVFGFSVYLGKCGDYTGIYTLQHTYRLKYERNVRRDNIEYLFSHIHIPDTIRTLLAILLNLTIRWENKKYQVLCIRRPGFLLLLVFCFVFTPG